MHRRALLATAAGLTASGLAGCFSNPLASGEVNTAGPSTPATRTPSRVTQLPGGIDLPVDDDQLLRGAPRDAIPAITQPAFADDWAGVTVEYFDQGLGREETIEPRLADEDEVLVVRRDGDARAYPLRVLNWHEVVNDSFAGPLLVTYCPLCSTGIAARRTVNGSPTTFGVSGLLFRSNLVMYDEATDSLWNQVTATAIQGDVTGTRLPLVTASITSWTEFQTAHPDGQVLLPPPASSTIGDDPATRDYTTDPYEEYARSRQTGIAGTADESGLHPKTKVIGVVHDETAKAYPLPVVRAEDGVINDRVGDLPVVVVETETSVAAYVRRIDGETVTFERNRDGTVQAGGSRWATESGRALSGDHEGETLRPASERTAMFWFAWREHHPNTTLYGDSDDASISTGLDDAEIDEVDERVRVGGVQYRPDAPGGVTDHGSSAPSASRSDRPSVSDDEESSSTADDDGTSLGRQSRDSSPARRR